LGQVIGLDALAALPKQILFAFFDGEQWGYLGSRAFLEDVASFHCAVPSVRSVDRVASDQPQEDRKGCIDPPRPSTYFQRIQLSAISAVVEAKQVGSPAAQNKVTLQALKACFTLTLPRSAVVAH
jgi:hypothetical protein